MNRKHSTANFIVFVLVTLVVVGPLVAVLQLIAAPAPPGKSPQHTKAVINLNSSDKSCQQYAGKDFGHVVKYAFPLLNKGGDSIVWHGQIDGGGPNQKVEVKFPPGQSPFSNDTFGEDQDSGPVSSSAAAGDYPFATVSVGGTLCSKFTDPGVHVN